MKSLKVYVQKNNVTLRKLSIFFIFLFATFLEVHPFSSLFPQKTAPDTKKGF